MPKEILSLLSVPLVGDVIERTGVLGVKDGISFFSAFIFNIGDDVNVGGLELLTLLREATDVVATGAVVIDGVRLKGLVLLAVVGVRVFFTAALIDTGGEFKTGAFAATSSFLFGVEIDGICGGGGIEDEAALLMTGGLTSGFLGLDTACAITGGELLLKL